MTDVVLEVTGLTKEFAMPRRGAAPVTAVSEVSLALSAGGSLAVVGESGSGKTTLSRMIVGLERPTRGSIVLARREWTTGRRSAAERRARGRQIQMVFQDPYSSLSPRQRIRDAIGEVLTIHGDLGRDDRARRIDELLEQVGLDPRQGRALPRALSGGQRQRAAIARALAADPKVLVLDEAVSALDVSVQAQVLNLLADVREQTGVAFLFISHDLAVVRQIADDVMVMSRGVVVERGGTAAVLSAPQHEYTQTLIESIPRPGWRPRRRDRPSVASATSAARP